MAFAQINELIGKTINKIDSSEDKIIFHCSDGIKYTMLHFQDCCETVTVEDIIGDLEDLIGTPILKASEDISEDNLNDIEKDYQEESYTWTFYNLSTIKGSVTIRWYGESNGYYSESVYLCKEAPQNDQQH